MVERDNKLIGGTVKWRISLEALTLVPGTAPKLPQNRDDAG